MDKDDNDDDDDNDNDDDDFYCFYYKSTHVAFQYIDLMQYQFFCSNDLAE